MKKLNLQIFVILFFVSPLLSFPLIIYYIYLRKEYAYTFLALFLGFVALLYPPAHDLFRHNMFYFECVGLEDAGIVVKKDVIFYTLTTWFAKWNINFELIRFLFIFLSYQIYFSIFLSIQKENRNLTEHRKVALGLFLLLLFSIRFFTICIGLRQGLATAFVTMGAYRLLVENRKSAFWFLLLAPLTHISLLVASVGVLLVKFIRINFKLGLFLAVVSYCISMIFMNYLSSVFGDNVVGASIEGYTSGYWGVGGAAEEQISLKGKIAAWLNQIQTLPFIYFMYKTRANTKYFSFVMFCLILCAVTFPYFAVLDRMIMLFMSTSVFYFLQSFDGSKMHMRVSKIGLFLIVICFSISLFSERRIVGLSREYKLITPVPYILLNNYNEAWVLKNASELEK